MGEDQVALAAKLREFQRRQMRRDLLLSGAVVLGIACAALVAFWLLDRFLNP